jgi:C4-type Zn-finger protein
MPAKRKTGTPDLTIGDLRARYTSAVDENTARIEEQIGYARGRISKGRPETVGLIVDDIAAASQRISAAVSALNAIDETEKALREESR